MHTLFCLLQGTLSTSLMSLHQVDAAYPAEGLSSSCYSSNWPCAPLTDLLAWGTFLAENHEQQKKEERFLSQEELVIKGDLVAQRHSWPTCYQ